MRKITSFFKKFSKNKEEADVCIETSQGCPLEGETGTLEDAVTFENGYYFKIFVALVMFEIILLMNTCSIFYFFEKKKNTINGFKQAILTTVFLKIK